MSANKPQTIDEYIAGFPKETQPVLEEIRKTIQKAAPEAEEIISYDMPTFTLGGSYLIYFAGWKKHVALYPVSGALLEELGEELSKYKGTKGSVHFPLDKPMPLDLITRIVKIRMRDEPVRSQSK
ncbi:iron chaperone [Dyadobacter pollutisoli]|uniref:DUF1801 domain-containing protein n=1 Tax=Dyadobacter pollutisoli TaxID=2910158 RepID=A0A9E8NJQ2_9BACT|nr:DUF1801 domain-containing protein [Dyadobacter pollutisoli]WAC15279.1 DUF1801 domain-containing protein [Dyadobacter pollutisoli]